MVLLLSVVFVGLVAAVECDLTFPPGFKFGAASASYQVEGAWNVSDKAESIWDHLTHTKPQAIADGSNGDVACDSYHLYKRDVEMCKEMGLHFYRISVSWPRLLPNGFANKVSEDGAAYYNNLINELLKNGIEPVISIYHWDMPQSLQNLGGWANPFIVEWFGEYARVVYKLFGDRVKTWLTINEPIAVCDIHYNFGLIPNSGQQDLGSYYCNKHVLLAHAKAYRIYNEEFKPKYHGRVSLTNQLPWVEPQSDSQADKDLAELSLQYIAGRYCHPIFSKEGGWPKDIEDIIAKKSKAEGFPTSRLPAFTQKEIDYIKGTFDFIGMNYYTSRIVRPLRENEPVNMSTVFAGLGDVSVSLEKNPQWEAGASSWFFVFPPGLRRQLAWLKEKYGDHEIMIFENGYSSNKAGNTLQDDKRVQYYRDHLEQVWLAIKEDGVRVTAYTAWTLFDNFEWMDGYTRLFGLYEVDFTSPQRTRTPRKSAKYYANVIKAHRVLEPSEVFEEDAARYTSSSSSTYINPLLGSSFFLMTLL